MRLKLIKVAGIGLAVACLLLFFPDCSRVGELRTETKSIERGDAESLRAEIDISSGVLNVKGGAEKLAEAEFIYKLEALKPEIGYRIMDRQGVLTIKQPREKGWKMGSRVRNDWNLRFNSRTPTSLRLVLGGGAKAALDLHQLTLTKLDFDMTSGEVAANVSGDQNDLARLDIETDSGDMDIKMNGHYSSLSRIKAVSTSGDLTLDLSGTWGCGLDGTIRTVSGDVKIRLPGNAGVRVRANTGSGSVEAGSLRFEDGEYLNAASGAPGVTLNLGIFTSSGNITLIPAE